MMKMKKRTYKCNIDKCSDCGKIFEKGDRAMVTKFHSKVISKDDWEIIIDEQFCPECYNKQKVIDNLPCWMTT